MHRSVGVIALALLAGLLVVPQAATAADGPELVPNGGFDAGTPPWFATQDMTMRTDGRLCVDVPGGTSTAWSSMVGVDGVPIVAGTSYELAFTAEATAPVVIRALVQQPADPWTATFEANPALGGGETEFRYPFTPTMDLPTAQLAFQLGGASTDWTLCLDDVSIRAVDSVSTAPTTDSRLVVNQVGYLPDGPKRATLLTDAAGALGWTLRDAQGETVESGETEPRGVDPTAGAGVHVIDFGDADATGEGFTLEADGVTSHPFAIEAGLYAGLRHDALQYFTIARSGIDIGVPGYEREAGHVGVAPNRGDTAVGCQAPQSFTQGWTCDYELDVSGGWYDAGDHGKYVVNGGIAVHQLLSTYERALRTGTEAAFADGTMDVPESSNGVPDLLDEARWELEWMLRMQVPTGKDLAGMAHHKVQDDGWTGLPLLPADDPQARQLHRPSTAATLNLVAVAAQSARLFADHDPAFADQLESAARVGWEAAVANPALYAPAEDGNAGGGAYDDDDVTDEFYWAAAELFLTTGESAFETAVLDSPLHEADLFTDSGFDWGHTALLGRLDLATVESDLPGQEGVIESVVALAERSLETQTTQNFGQPFAPAGGYQWGSNHAILNTLVVVATAFDLSGDERFRAAVVEGMDYVLGRNAMDLSYVTGYGTVYAHNQHSRWFAHTLDPSLPRPPDGSLAGGPNRSLQDPVAQRLFPNGCPDQLCYVDDVQSYATNEITINWNSSLAWVAAFVADDGTAIEPVVSEETTDVIPFLIAGGVLAVLLGTAVVIWRQRQKRR